VSGHGFLAIAGSEAQRTACGTATFVSLCTSRVALKFAQYDRTCHSLPALFAPGAAHDPGSHGRGAGKQRAATLSAIPGPARDQLRPILLERGLPVLPSHGGYGRGNSAARCIGLQADGRRWNANIERYAGDPVLPTVDPA
jgi:hypothetical protein